jgi:hypothetical protein
MKLATSARFAGSAWELARFALLLSAAARVAGSQMPRLVPLLLPLAVPGLVMAGGFAASAMLAQAGDGLLPLLRMGKLLEAISGIAAVAAAFLLGPPAAFALLGLLAAVTVIDLVFFLLLLSSNTRGTGPGSETAQGSTP